jgi:hypothetical protein
VVSSPPLAIIAPALVGGKVAGRPCTSQLGMGTLNKPLKHIPRASAPDLGRTWTQPFLGTQGYSHPEANRHKRVCSQAHSHVRRHTYADAYCVLHTHTHRRTRTHANAQARNECTQGAVKGRLPGHTEGDGAEGFSPLCLRV